MILQGMMYTKERYAQFTHLGCIYELTVKDSYIVAFDKYLPKEVERRYHLLEQDAKSANCGLWKYHNLDCLGDQILKQKGTLKILQEDNNKKCT